MINTLIKLSENGCTNNLNIAMGMSDGYYWHVGIVTPDRSIVISLCSTIIRTTPPFIYEVVAND